MKKYILTAEHKEILKTYKDKWIANALSTKPMDEEEKEICRKNVIKMYKAANLNPPKNIVFVSSPFVLRFASGLASAIWNQQTHSAIYSETYSATYSETYSATISATDLATDSAIHSATHSATISATDLATHAASISATDLATDSAIHSATYSETISATDSATYAATDSAIRSTTRLITDLSNYYITNNCLNELDFYFNLNGAGIKAAQSIYNCWQGGNQWSGWCAYQSFFRDVAKLGESHDIDFTNYNIWEELCLHSGPRIVTEDFCMISDRPELLLLDEQNRPHSLNGPYCRWRDGSAIYAVHGVLVPGWIIERKQDITIELINKEENIEVRRVMINIYGQERYLKESNFEVLDIDKDQFGRQRRLLRIKQEEDEDIVKVEVINSTAELDKSYNTYYLSVDPELRPLLKDPDENSENITRQELINKLYLGKPQKMTCHNAVASTFGKYGKEYGKYGQIRQGDVFIEFKDGTNQLKFRES